MLLHTGTGIKRWWTILVDRNHVLKVV